MNARTGLPALVVILAHLVVMQKATGQRETGRLGRPTFGHRQLEQLLDDRPDMRGMLPTDHSIYKWAVEGFNGERFGERIYWLNAPPRDGHTSEFSPPYMGIPAFLRIAKGSELTPVDKWTLLIFELHNVDQSKEFEILTERAAQGLINGEEYATGCVQVEFNASKKTKEFLQAHPLPVRTSGINKYYEKAMGLPSTFEKYRAQCKANNEPFGNYQFFLDYYRRVLAAAANQAERRQ